MSDSEPRYMHHNNKGILQAFFNLAVHFYIPLHYYFPSLSSHRLATVSICPSLPELHRVMSGHPFITFWLLFTATQSSKALYFCGCNMLVETALWSVSLCRQHLSASYLMMQLRSNKIVFLGSFCSSVWVFACVTCLFYSGKKKVKCTSWKSDSLEWKKKPHWCSEKHPLHNGREGSIFHGDKVLLNSVVSVN